MFGFKKKYDVEMKVRVEGLNCGHCEAAVSKAIQEIDGVKDVKASHEKQEVVISSNTEISREAVKEAIEKAGYTFVEVLS